MVQKERYFVSIIWGYSARMYDFSIEENYHLHVLNIAKELGCVPVVIIKQNKGDIENDPKFDKTIKVVNYKNIFNYFFQIIKYSSKGAVFYVNSVEPQSLIVPFLAKKTIFMGHTHPIRQNKIKQKIFNFSMRFFSKIRLNNKEEKNFLLEQNLKEDKLFVLPLVVSNKIYSFTNDYLNRRDLVCFGNITITKNLPTIIKAFELVLKKITNIKLHFVGSVLEDNIKNLVKEKKISDNIIFHGFKSPKEANILLNNFLINLNSSFLEGQCVAVYNAVLAGCALCLPNIMSFRGVFQDKAMFHSREDYKKLAENIIFYLENPEIRIKHNNLCREMIINNYNYNIISEKLKKMLTF